MPYSNIVTYHRPEELDTALRLLREGKGRAVPLAGGTSLIGTPPRDVEAVVDLRDLRLDWITTQGDGGLSLGAMVTLEQLARDDRVRSYASGGVAQAARYAAGSLVRARATVGGTLVARAASSDLVAMLLALSAEVVVNRSTEKVVPLDDLYRRREYLLQPGSLITELRLPPLPEGASVRLERVARTPMDQPILAVAARVDERTARIGIVGLDEHPTVLDLPMGEAGAAEREQSLAAVRPQSDHLASAEYRREMVGVLVGRVLEA